MEGWLWWPRRAILFAWTGFFYAPAGLANRPKEKELIMTCNPSQVIVLTDDDQCALLHGLSAHHRDFPEVRAEGSSPKAAAARLAELLSLSLDCTPSDWRRQSVQQAIADVRAFAEHDRS